MAALSPTWLFVYMYWPLLLSALVIYHLISNRYQKGLHRIPGPWIRSVTTIPRMWSVYKGEHHLSDLWLHSVYGKVIRLAPNLVSVSDPSEISQLYGVNTKFTKSSFYDLAAFHDDEGLVPDPFVIREDRRLHARMKRNAANAYSMNGLVQCEPWIDPVTSRFLTILDGHADEERICDLGKLIKHFAMDAVCSLTFGSDFHYLERGDSLNFFGTLDLYTAYMSIFGHVAWLHPWLLGNPKIAALIIRGDTSNQAMMELSALELERYRNAAPNENDHMTFLGRLTLNQRLNEKSITDREIVTHALGNVSAGSDTTAIAIRSALYLLMTHEVAYSRICHEIRSQLTLPVTFQSAYALPYLRAVIQEAMRLHPSVGQILARTVPHGGAIVAGHPLKAGCQVGMSPWVLHRNPDVFVNPDEFRPERWIVGEAGTDEEHLKRMTRSFFAFGHGRHTCSGKHISIMEITKLLPTILLKYDIELASPDMQSKFTNWWFTQQEKLDVRLTRRS